MPLTISPEWILVLITLVLWELPWKAQAMWHAGKRNDKAWFAILLLLNTAGILPIMYLLSTKSRSHKN